MTAGNIDFTTFGLGDIPTTNLWSGSHPGNGSDTGQAVSNMANYKYLVLTFLWAGSTQSIMLKTEQIAAGYNSYGVVITDGNATPGNAYIASGSVDTGLTVVKLVAIGYVNNLFNSSTTSYTGRNGTSIYALVRVDGLGKA